MRIFGTGEICYVRKEVMVYRCGISATRVYQLQYAGTIKATSMTWIMDEDVDVFVNYIKSKGVKFEHDLTSRTFKDDILFIGNLKVVWFMDPDGNILS